MRKRVVLIVLLCLASTYSLLAQTTKQDSAKTTAKDTAKTAKPKAKPADKKALDKALKAAADKNRKDSLANLKALKLASDNSKKDSITNAKILKPTTDKAQKTAITAKTTTPVVSSTIKKDSAIAVKTPVPTAIKPATMPAVKDTAKTVVKKDKAIATPVKAVTTAPPNVPAAKDTAKLAIKKTGTTPIILDKKALAAQKDSINNAKANLKKQKKELSKLPPVKTAADSAALLRDSIKMNALIKNLSNPLYSKKDKQKVQDSIAIILKARSKDKGFSKGKSAKQLAKEAFKADPENFSEKDMINKGFGIRIDSASRDSVRHIDIPFTNARPYAIQQPESINVKFFHRYWRDIDLSDPKNKKFATYHATLISSLLAAIKSKEVKAYSAVALPPANPTGDAFTMPIAYDEMMVGLSDTSVVNELDKDGNITGTKTVPNPFTPEKIAGYRIKEDVYYDKVRGRYITRIIGIAPLIKVTLSSGEVLNVQPLCWIKYKDLRKILVTIDIDPTKKVGDSMDDVFLQRRFYARIVQESSPQGLRIKDYKTDPNDQVTEANRMEKKVLTFKKGAWVYMMINKDGIAEVADDAKYLHTGRTVKIPKGQPEGTDLTAPVKPADQKSSAKSGKQKLNNKVNGKTSAATPVSSKPTAPPVTQVPPVTPANQPPAVTPANQKSADTTKHVTPPANPPIKQ